ncbi:diguanylate cyclase [Roseomonas mucosa]|uniref:GGDEF domain-containing protein n=1 Tax=Roseomonas mucosa TaxID=207340 RepID=UPI0028CEC1C2|nr:diguanylate cyclase [Roseomonas mucosa]MDT8356500.1 diguanylate cyclase [Roseomonas mucosa]
MIFPPLHAPTLLVATALVIAFSGLVLLLSRGRGRDAGPLALWGIALILGAAGLALTAVAHDGGGAWGGAAILLATALSWTAARRFAGRQARPGLILLGPAAWLLWAGPVGDGLERAGLAGPWHATPVFAIGAAYTIATALELRRRRDEAGDAGRIATLLLTLHAVLHLARAASLVLATEGSWLLSPDIGMVLVAEALLHTIGLAFLFLAMTRERAERQALEPLRRLALSDGLTGLANRRRLDETLARAVRENDRMALLMVDVDHFKAFNDTYGHQPGDDCLRAIGKALGLSVRLPGEMAARYGGEEFILLLPGADEAAALARAEDIHARIAALAIAHGGSPPGRVTVSIGIATRRSHDTAGEAGAPDRLLRDADAALYAAKAEGRNRTRGPGSVRGPVLRPSLPVHLHPALERARSA